MDKGFHGKEKWALRLRPEGLQVKGRDESMERKLWTYGLVFRIVSCRL